TLAIGDLEGDGLPDFLVAPADAPKIRTFLHPGTAGGQNGPTIDSGGAYSVLEAADLDGEGWPDLVGTKYATAGVALVTLLGEKGRVKSHAAMPAGDLPAAVAVGRIDGDPFTDLVVASTGSDYLAVFSGQPGGAFAP